MSMNESVASNPVLGLLGENGIIFIASSIVVMVVSIIGYYALISFLSHYFKTSVFKKIDRWLTIVVFILLIIIAPLLYWYVVLPLSALASGDTSSLIGIISN